MVQPLADEALIMKVLEEQADPVLVVRLMPPAAPQLLFANPAARSFLAEGPAAGAHALLTAILGSRYSDQIAAWSQQSHPEEVIVHFPARDQYYRFRGRRLDEGIMSIEARNCTAEQQALLLGREEAEKYRLILDTSGDGVMVLHPMRERSGLISDFRIEYCNVAGFQLGRLPADAVGRSVLDVLPALREADGLGHHKEVADTGVPYRYETHFTDEAGNSFGWFIIHLTRLPGGAVLSRYTDISALKESERQVEAQHSLLESIYASMLSSLFACTAVRGKDGRIEDFRLIFANDAFARMSGREASRLKGHRLLRLFPALRRHELFKDYCRVLETGKPYHGTIYFEGKIAKGWFEVSAVRRGSDGLVVTTNDVTEVVQVKAALESAAGLLQQMIDVAPTGIFTLAPVYASDGRISDFRITRLNRTLAAYAGLPAEALQGQLHGHLFPGYFENGVFDIYCRLLESGGETRFERRYQYGTLEVWLDVTARQVNGELMVSFHDFSELKRLQLQLESTVEELQRSNDALKEFAYSASHDLQEPLRKIIYFTDRLRPEIFSESGHRSFDRVQDAARRMSRLIDDLLTYSKLGLSAVVMEEASLAEVVAEAQSNLEVAFMHEGGHLNIGALPHLRCNRPLLVQAFQNLFGNSLKYRHPDRKPQLHLSCQFLTAPPEGHKVAGAGPVHYLRLQDNGIGFAPEEAQRIFQVFQRLHGHQEYEGNGIGLALVQRVIQLHGGAIWAEGVPGTGATFHLLLPA